MLIGAAIRSGGLTLLYMWPVGYAVSMVAQNKCTLTQLVSVLLMASGGFFSFAGQQHIFLNWIYYAELPLCMNICLHSLFSAGASDATSSDKEQEMLSEATQPQRTRGAPAGSASVLLAR